MSNPSTIIRTTSIVVICLFSLSACSVFKLRERHNVASISDYLYSNNIGHVDTPSVPVMEIPLRVGLVFVPESRRHRTSAITAKEKQDIMEGVKKQFSDNPLIDKIEIIPESYLLPQGGFANLNQIRNIFQTDIIALLSYDQVQHSSNDLLSITYWTVVGAYIFRGEKNDTSTLLDLAVYHIPTKQLLFRAPGTSTVKKRSTPITREKQLSDDAAKGIIKAGEVLTANLQDELDRFIVRVKDNPSRYNISTREGYTGAGNIPSGLLLFMTLALALAARNRFLTPARIDLSESKKV